MAWRCALLLFNAIKAYASLPSNVLHTNGEVLHQDVKHNKNLVMFLEPRRSAVSFYTMSAMDTINQPFETGIRLARVDNASDCERNANLYEDFNLTACDSDALPFACIFKNATLVHVFQDEGSILTMGETVDRYFNL